MYETDAVKLAKSSARHLPVSDLVDPHTSVASSSSCKRGDRDKRR